ncbi:MAG: response regulator transcription factor [Anaerolineae bacterium]|nr:response regulator transcription factor [Anaerolineae bacterium]
MAHTILVVEDEKRIAHWVRTYLEKAGFTTLVAYDGKTGLYMARRERPDLIVLDLMLPEMDGWEVCQTLRRESDVPIIMLTARGREQERIHGLRIGADDYVTKPFSPDELVARVQATLRRATGKMRTAEVLRAGNICLDVTAHQCRIDDAEVPLSPTQFKLLEVLMTHAGQVLTREQLVSLAMDDAFDGFDRAIDVQIRRLRQRVEHDPSAPRHILTVYGLGYKFEP